MNDEFIAGEIIVGPVPNSNSYKYGLKFPDGRIILSEHDYHNAASATFDSRRVQYVTDRGTLVPNSRYSPDLN